MKTKTFKRILTVILSLSFVLSTVFGALSTVNAVDNSSLAPRATVSSDAERAIPAAPSGTNNLFLGLTPTVYGNKGASDAIVGNPDGGAANAIANLTDGQATTKADLGGFRFKDAEGNDMSETWSTALTFELPASSDLNQLVVVNDGGLASTITEHYAVFASDDPAKLYKDESFVIDISGNTNQRNIITFNSGIKAKYVGIRVYDPGKLATAQQQYIRMYEIALYGVLGEISSNATYLADDVAALPTLGTGEANLIAGTLPKFYYDRGTATLTESAGPENDAAAAPLSYISDGDPATSAAIGGNDLRYNNNGTFMGETWSTYWTYDLKKISELSTMTFVHHSSSGLRTEHFQIYLSDTVATLYNIANMVLDVDGNTNRRTIVSFPADTKARYVGIKYLNPGETGNFASSNRYVRMNELALYGVLGTDPGPDAAGGGEGGIVIPEGTPSGDFNMTSSNEYAFDATLGEKNFIAGITENINYVYYSDFGNSKSSGKIDSTKLGDGLFNDNLRKSVWFFAEYDEATSTEKYIGKGIEEGKYLLDLTIPLGGKKNITGVQMMNQGSPLANYKYQIYLANDEVNLFKEENMIINAVNTEGLKVNTFKKAVAEDLIGSFIGIRIIDPTNEKGVGSADAYVEDDGGKCYVYPRINEFAVYGSDVEAVAENIVMDNELVMPDTTEKNLLKDQSFVSMKFINTDPKHYAGVGTFNCGPSGGGDTLTDGSPEGDWRSSSYFSAYIDENGNAQYLGNGITEGSMYYDYYFDIGTESKLSTLAIFHHKDKNLRTAKYEIYFGNSEATLFDAENKIADIDNNEGTQRNLFNLKKLNNDEQISARYFGIRILDPTVGKGVGPTAIVSNLSNGNNVYPRFNEIALYGEYIDPDFGSTTILFDNQGVIPDWGRNLAKGFYPVVNGVTNGSGGRLSVVNESHINDEILTNDDYRTNTFKFAENVFGTINIYGSNGDGSKYVDLIYDLKSEAVIDGMSIIHHKTTALRTKDYEIFASTTSADLFNPEKSLGRVDNKGYYRNAWNYKEMGKSFNARYIALRVYNPTQHSVGEIDASVADIVYLRLLEWSIFGQYLDPDFTYKEKFIPLSKQNDYSVFESYGYNILTGNNPIGAQVNGGAINLYTASSNRFVDGDVTTGFDIGDGGFVTQDGSNYFQMYYDLSEKGTVLYKFTDFIYLGLNQNNPAAATGWWQLYISDDEDMLWDSANMAFEYNALDPVNPDVGCQGQVINFNKPIIGCYVGIRILACNTTLITSVYPRIYELAIYGDYSPVDKTPVNIAGSMPVDAYIRGTSGDLKEVDDSNFTVKEGTYLTDDNAETAATIKTSKNPLNILYNLCQDIDISEISISAAEGNFKNVKIYASNDANEVWSDKALVASYSGAGKNTVSKKFSKPKNMRYVRFEILDEVDSVSISDIEIIGPAYLRLKNKNLARNNANVDFFTQNLKTGKITYFTPRNANFLTNASLGDAFGFTQGIEGKETVNILATLDDVKTVNQILLYFPKRAYEFMPTLTKIYVGNSIEEVTALDAKPTFTLKGNFKDSLMDIQTKPVVGQFVNIQFVKGGNGFDYFDEMSYALAELRIMGTAVKGKDALSTNVVEFEDKKLGIKWGIKKITANDIYSEVVSSTVTVSKVTNWQRRSLEKTPYMEIIGGKKYTFKFYDLTGKEITDFGGRKVEISFKHRDGMSAGTAMVGRSANKWYVEPYDSNSDVYDGYVTIYELDRLEDMTFSILNMISSTDPYWDNIGALEDYGDEKPQYAPTTALDASTSSAKIVTEDGDFYIDPRGALRLPIEATFSVEVTTWEIPENIYGALSTNGVANPDEIAVSYVTDLTDAGFKHEFDGRIKVMLRIPEIIDGYFSSYQLVNVDDYGNSEFIEYTREGDYIFFETASLDDYALIGVDYHPDGDAIGMDGFVGVDGEASPETGDHETILYIILAAVSLLGIILLNVRTKSGAHSK